MADSNDDPWNVGYVHPHLAKYQEKLSKQRKMRPEKPVYHPKVRSTRTTKPNQQLSYIPIGDGDYKIDYIRHYTPISTQEYKPSVVYEYHDADSYIQPSSSNTKHIKLPTITPTTIKTYSYVANEKMTKIHPKPNKTYASVTKSNPTKRQQKASSSDSSTKGFNQLIESIIQETERQKTILPEMPKIQIIPYGITWRKTFKVLSSVARKIKFQELRSKYFPGNPVLCTDWKFSKYCKVTLQAEYKDQLQALYQDFKDQTRGKFEELPFNHCTACYRIGHERKHCRNVCSYCLEEGHLRASCNLNPKRSSTVSLIKAKEDRRNFFKIRNKKLLRKYYDGKPWYQRPNEFDIATLDNLIPIGSTDNKKQTIALDVEGSGDAYEKGLAGCFSLHGWVGNAYGQTVDHYFGIINHMLVTDPNTKITGNQIEDLYYGRSLSHHKKIIKQIISGKRLIIHGGADIDKLRITSKELETWNVEVVDTASMFNSPFENNPIALEKLTKFFTINFWDRENSRSLIQGHSAEMDARATLKCYRRAMQLENLFGQIPSRTEIDTFFHQNKTWLDWVKTFQIRHLKIDPTTGEPIIPMELINQNTPTKKTSINEPTTSTSNDPWDQEITDVLTFPTEPVDDKVWPSPSWDWPN